MIILYLVISENRKYYSFLCLSTLAVSVDVVL